MIPVEAIEAALAANLAYKSQRSLDNAEKQMRAVLEAAAPHMQERVSTLDALVLLEPGTVLQGPDFHEETYKCTAPGTFHDIASPTEYRASELVGRGPFTIIYRSRADGDD